MLLIHCIWICVLIATPLRMVVSQKKITKQKVVQVEAEKVWMGNLQLKECKSTVLVLRNFHEGLFTETLWSDLFTASTVQNICL